MGRSKSWREGAAIGFNRSHAGSFRAYDESQIRMVRATHSAFYQRSRWEGKKIACAVSGRLPPFESLDRIRVTRQAAAHCRLISKPLSGHTSCPFNILWWIRVAWRRPDSRFMGRKTHSRTKVAWGEVTQQLISADSGDVTRTDKLGGIPKAPLVSQPQKWFTLQRRIPCSYE
jgi:hypothetical protein